MAPLKFRFRELFPNPIPWSFNRCIVGVIVALLAVIYDIKIFRLKVSCKTLKPVKPLFKQVLREELCSVLSDLSSKNENDDSLVEEAVGLVRLARDDFKVWKNGLDAAYNKFVAVKPSQSPFAAVLLSIL